MSFPSMASCASLIVIAGNRNLQVMLKDCGSNMFSFGENDYVSVYNNSIEPVWIQCDCAVDEEENLVLSDSDGFLRIDPDQTFVISRAGSEAYFLPGSYIFKSRSFQSVFIVTPMSDITQNALDNMVHILESVDKRLVLNYVRTRNDGESLYLNQINRMLEDNLNDFRRNVYRIINEFSSGYRQKVVFSPIPRKQSSKTIRKNILNEGRKVGSFNSVKEFTYDTEANRALKAVCLEANRKLKRLSKKFSSEFDRISFTGQKDLESILISLKDYCDRYISLLNTILSQPEMAAVPYIPGERSLFYRNDYLRVQRFLFELSKPGEKDEGGFRFARSSELFENFAGILIDRALRQSGYSYIRASNLSFTGDREKAAALKYFCRRGYALLRHTPQVNNFREAKTNTMVSFMSHVTPDYTLEFYSDDGTFKGAMVCEVKYRPSSQLFDDSDNKETADLTLKPDIADQVDSYLTFGFKKPDGKVKTGAVDSLFFIYPSMSDVTTAVAGDIEFFAGVDPSKNLSEMTVIEKLRKKIAEFSKASGLLF